MEELIRAIAQALVEHPEAVNVTRREEADAIVLTLTVADGDMGRVIGKQGRIAKAMRAVLRAAASKESKRVILDIGE